MPLARRILLYSLLFLLLAVVAAIIFLLLQSGVNTTIDKGVFV